MKIFQWGAGVVAAALLLCGGAQASDSEVEAMQKTMASMKQEMAAMRAEMDAERQAMRANAGGDPEAMMREGSGPVVTLEGELITRYTLGSYNTYDPQIGRDGYAASSGRRAIGEWGIDTAEIAVNAQLTEDTAVYMSIALENATEGNSDLESVLDEAYFTWSSVGGTGLGLKLGLQDIGYGMYNSPASPYGRVLVLDSYTESFNGEAPFGMADAMTGIELPDNDLTRIGLSMSYEWDQVYLTAGVFGERGNTGIGDLGVLDNNDLRNIGIVNHFIQATFNPCWMEDLFLTAGFMGRFDDGQGAAPTSYAGEFAYLNNMPIGINTDGTTVLYSEQANGPHGTAYQPTFNVGAAYMNEKWAAYIDYAHSFNVGYYERNFGYALTIGGDYFVTDRLGLGVAFDLGNMNTHKDFQDMIGSDVVADDATSISYRISVGARYSFASGIYVAGQYYHQGTKAWGYHGTYADDNTYSSKWRDADMFVLETGVTF